MSLNRTLANLINTDGDVKAANLDLAASITVVEALDSLPTSNLTAGDQAYVKGTSRFYVSNGAGWYNAALVNATPSLSIDPSGAITLATDGSTTTITLTATDSDYPDAALTYTVESDGSFGGLATVSQDSSVFTITPLSEDSATTTSAVLTFKASDGVSFGSGNRTLTLEFKVANSNYTTLMLKADTAGTDNQVDASTNAYTITENGNVKSTAFTPYHPGGYSTYFNDASSSHLIYSAGNEIGFGTGDFTVEFWANPDFSGATNQKVIDTRNASNWIVQLDARTSPIFTWFNGASIFDYDISNTENVWTHYAVAREGTSLRLFVNGVLVDTVTDSVNYTESSGNVYIGRRYNSTVDYVDGYIRDFRVVKGTAVYTSTFTPPTESLTAISGTSLLTCHLPYIADGSTNGHAITVNGNTSTERFGPYDYKRYTEADYSGSVYFDGTGDWMTLDNSSEQMLPETGDFTVEFWFNTPNNTTRQDPYSSYTSTTGWAVAFSLSNAGDITPYYGNSTPNQTSGGQFEANVWNHFAMARSGSTLKIFMNGKTILTDASDTRDYSGTSDLYIGAAGNETNPYTGYLSDVRFVKGTAVYTADFTPPTAPLTAITNTQLLTCTNKNDIWDAATGNVLTKSGDVTASNTQRQFTSSSATYFDGTGDSISFTAGYDDPLYNFGTHDWTLEGWFYIQTLSSGRNLFSFLRASTNEATPHVYTQGTDLRYYVLGADRIIGSSALTVNTWHHIAATRSGNDHKLFVDGTQVGSTWTNAQTYVQGRPVLGDYHTSLGNLTGGTNLLHGYAQDFRITKGLARYTSNFTPPTAEFSG